MSKIKKIIAVIVCVICIFATLCISVSASNVYTIPINQPRADLYSGYIEILYKNNGSNEINAVVGFWHVNGGSDVESVLDGNPYVGVTVTSSSVNLSIVNQYSPDGKNYLLSYGAMNNKGGNWYWRGSSGSAFSGAITIVAYKVYGNYVLNGPMGQGDGNWNILYSENSAMYEAILFLANSIGSGNQAIIDNANQNASQTQQNQNENTDKIIENQQQIQENEKTEAESSGQGSVNDVSGAIEDKSVGFISAISNLVGSMSYNGTACAWSFPAIKLPAIDGVMPEYQLTEEQPIDFEYWVDKIPSDILLVVRSVLTIALIGYCFKELYGTISYVLTLKGGGNNE